MAWIRDLLENTLNQTCIKMDLKRGYFLFHKRISLRPERLSSLALIIQLN